MIVYIILAIIIIAFILSFEFIHWSVVGYPLNDYDIEESIDGDSAIHEYKLNPFDRSNNLLTISGSSKFISCGITSLTSRWYISGVGCVPRWSMYHKKFNRIRKELILNKD